jgi:hypothetical protein
MFLHKKTAFLKGKNIGHLHNPLLLSLYVTFKFDINYCSYLLKATPDNKAVPCLLMMQLLRLMPRSNHNLRKWRENCRKMAVGGIAGKMARKFKT